MRGRFLLSLVIFSWGIAKGQNWLDVRVDTIQSEQPLTTVLAKIEQQTKLKFFYVEKWLEPYKVPPSQSGHTLSELLFFLFDGTDIDFTIVSDYAVIFRKDPTNDIKRRDFLRSATERKVNSRKQVIGDELHFVPGNSVVFSGVVSAAEDDKPLPGAAVYINDNEEAFSTNEKGMYNIRVIAGKHVVSYRALGYQEQIIDLAIYTDGELNIDLEETPTTLEEVVIQDQAIKDSRVSMTTIRFSDIKRTPSLLGEADVIKQIQMQAGVTSTSEASSGFSVRGGGMDQNLVLYDGVPIFNSTHALGFLTAFNADAVSEAVFYKGAIPSEYGGRVSSVLNMASKEGSYDKWHGVLGIGPITSHTTLGGPIRKDTSSFIFSFRASYSDWILKRIQTKFKEISNGSVFFWDGSFKYSQRLDNNAKITLSMYRSGDNFSLANDTINGWRNTAVAIRYDKTLSPQLFYSAGIHFGSYTYRVEQENPSKAFKLHYGVIYPGLRLDFNYNGARHKMNFGFQSTYYSFSPGTVEPTSNESVAKRVEMPKEQSLESAVYFSSSFNITDKLNVEVGLRLSVYNRFGPGKQYLYQAGQPREPESTIDSVSFGGWHLMKTYIGPEPRLALMYNLNQNSSLKLGYNRMYQYVHLISNTTVVTPVDIWQSSNAYFKPQISDQVSFGYFTSFSKGIYETSIEGYYKHLKNILDFRDGSNLILNPQLETALLPGQGKSYGIEFTLAKKTGKLTGELNYTYSRSLRQVNGKFDLDKVNEGDFYPAHSDLPHVINLNWRKQMSRKVFFTGTFVYHTGRPVSIPLNAYEVNNSSISNFTERNNFRIPDYHRLDLALVVEGSNRKTKFGQSHWAFSVYNVYARKNPYSVFFEDRGGGRLEARQLSLIGTAIPSISYGYRF